MRGHVEEWLFRDSSRVMLAFVEFGVEPARFFRSRSGRRRRAGAQQEDGFHKDPALSDRGLVKILIADVASGCIYCKKPKIQLLDRGKIG